MANKEILQNLGILVLRTEKAHITWISNELFLTNMVSTERARCACHNVPELGRNRPDAAAPDRFWSNSGMLWQVHREFYGNSGSR